MICIHAIQYQNISFKQSAYLPFSFLHCTDILLQERIIISIIT